MDKTHSCFVIMPFSATEHGPDDDRKKITEAQWSHIFQHWIKKAVESFQPEKLVCKRSPARPGNFIKDIVADLDSSGLVIADLTGAKANVYYELGIRHALRVGTIIITQHFDALPSDLRSYFVFEYVYSEKAHEYEDYYAKFEKKMHDTIQAWSDADDPSDSPVSDFLGIIHQKVERELEQEKEELKSIFAKLKEHFTHNFDVCEAILAYMKHEQPKDCDRLIVVDVFAIDTVYLRLVAYNWRHIGGGLAALEKLIIYQRRIFNEISVTWNVLHGSPEQPRLAKYLMKMLEEIEKEKHRFDEQWDVLSKAAIDTIKLVKHGKQT